MVKKRVNRGFHVAVIPKGPRSDRRSAFKKKSDGNQMCAIDLLAAVAGKLLLENESSSASSNEKETTDLSAYEDFPKKEVDHYDDDGLFKGEAVDQMDSQKEAACVPQSEALKVTLKDPNKCLHLKSEHHSQEASVVSNSCGLEYGLTTLKLGALERIGASLKLVSKIEGEYSRSCGEPWKHTTGSGIVKSIKFEEDKAVNVVHTISGSLPTKSIRSPSSKGYTPVTSSIQHRIFSLGSRDDDDNIFRCNQHSVKVKAYRPIPRRRVQKFLTYKYKKVSPTWKDHKCHNAVRGMRPVYQNHKKFYGREEWLSDIPLKKRKLFDQRLVLTSDKGNVAASSPKGYRSSFNSKDSHVRLNIKSLRVPEIYIEVSENVTVGSLKRKVLEAVTAMIDGVQVGVRLRGKKIRDDSRSLLQTGIASKDSLGKLAFELEPKSLEGPLTLCEDTPLALSKISNQLVRPPVSPATPSASCVASDPKPSPQTAIDNHSESNLEVVPTSPLANSLSNCELESKAIVPYSEINATPISVVSGDQKARRSEFAQRRTRRPFSVGEVEALVGSVEKFGTGRWRDVKICAFDNAKHRTYVDLKDKWKTLVHTAQIAPQQRRGQPVPQELLDRVLAAHAYWSQHQANQVCKHWDAVSSITSEVA